MKMGILGLALALGATLLMSAPALADTIDFESDTVGGKPDGWMSADSAYVRFTDTLGSDLQVADYANNQGNGRSLGVFGDDGSMLQMDFAGKARDLSLAFGNDDPGFSNPGDRAWLVLWNNGAAVAKTDVVMNRNDVMDQTIALNGVEFDQAFFYYGDANGNAIRLIEIVDDIRFNAVPEPGTLALAGLGAAVLFVGRRRRLRK